MRERETRTKKKIQNEREGVSEERECVCVRACVRVKVCVCVPLLRRAMTHAHARRISRHGRACRYKHAGDISMPACIDKWHISPFVADVPSDRRVVAGHIVDQFSF